MIVKLDRHLNSVQCSPYQGSQKLVVAACSNYGIIGPGRIYVIQQLPLPSHQHNPSIRYWDTQDAVLDVAWSEMDPCVLIASCANGQLLMVNHEKPDNAAVQVLFQGTGGEQFSVNWNQIQRNLFLSSSRDGLVRVWSSTGLNNPPLSVHAGAAVHAAVWSPMAKFGGNLFACACADGSFKIFDIRSASNQKAVPSINAHAHPDCLSLDWSKYDEHGLFTSGSDSTVKSWDLRMINNSNTNSAPVQTMYGHGMAVKRVKASPYDGRLLASVGYDMSMKLWDISCPQNPLVESYDAHSEFVFGLDWNNFDRGEVVTCSWDQTVHITRPRYLQQQQPLINR